MTTLTRCLGAAALVGVGFRLGRSRTRWERVRYLHAVADLEDARRDIEEHLDAAPRLWQRGFEAGQHLNELQLARTKVERDERSRAAWN